ncbi:FAD-dependent oxidoreductase [Paenibacillus sp. J2TS4]|uniref:FAD-dependent oxidoreductase n=1 Tax=Paenibacillus sp. J2TS4 TaxID=2807194 RepID=UPI001BCC5083|nr:FAD-dependent oxidoreductase [Paenibacillus sp. J2TS4]
MKRFAWLLSIVLLFVAGCEGDKKPGGDKGTPSHSSDPDIVLIGSEIEGMYLARAAADEGLHVVVLDPRSRPGGQLIQGEMLYLDEPFDGAGESLLQGRVKELFDRYKQGEIRKKEEFVNYFEAIADGIPIESGIEIIKIETEQDTARSKQKIKSLTYRTAAGEEKTVTAKYWVENTDFAALSSRLEVTGIPGIETVFGGSAKDYMAASIMMKFRKVDWARFSGEINQLGQEKKEEIYGAGTYLTGTFAYGFGNIGKSYSPSQQDVFLRGLNIINQRDGDVLINALLVFDVDPANSQRIEEALAAGRKETDQVVQHLRQQLPGWEEAEVNGYPEYLYIRDSDRYETEYVLQATDLFSGAMFWDNVSIAGYPIDLQGNKANPWGTSTGKPDKYGMPLRAFQLKGYTNVLTAGKNVGASAVAYGSARIQPNTSLAGEVIGIILGQIDGKNELADLSEKEMKKLHQYIKKNYGITLSGVKADNKIAGYSEEQLEQINKGKLAVE